MLVVIPTYNRSQLLGRTLKSLSQCQFPRSYRGTVVVENGEPMGASSIVNDFAKIGVRYLHVPIANKSASLNQVLQDVDDKEIVIFFDDDIRLTPGILLAYEVATKESGPDIFFGGPTGVDYESEPQPWLLKYLPESVRGNVNSDLTNIDVEQVNFLGCNWAAYAGNIKAVGGFDPHFGPGTSTLTTGQETETQNRMLNVGIRRKFVADAMVWHYVPAERCSPKWCINRAYRSSIQLGLQSNGSLFQRLENQSMLIFWKWVAACVPARFPRISAEVGIRQSCRAGFLEGMATKDSVHSTSRSSGPA